ncbi:hypothetical protein [Limnoglobus roseus]|uniref:Lipoprotein n=1 Tax=Limnoglobus roseus TaxID=2598579 RepID=A0A5C1AW76_9BACT|nr:hypothetical protein [Limnoglobus roseus]QEL21048.1 hypothetical protein PX52LOC_08177 [Limnoglobus roseus]
MKKWCCVALLALLAPLAVGCKRNTSSTPANAADTSGPAAVTAKRPPMTREEGEKKYNRLGETLPVRTPLADVVRYFGQEPDRWEGKDPDQKAIWVLDDGSEIAIEFYKGVSGSDSITLVNKK